MWDPIKNIETNLPDMPGRVVRVYPASGAVAMLPLTPANNWNPTVLFCGGSDMPESAYGDYGNPAIDTWDYPASNDCQRITPEPADGSKPAYTADDDMLEGRTMGQFIALPDGRYLVINGGLNGTAGYAKRTGETASTAQMPFGMSLASGPVLTPAIYDPTKPRGSRWSRDGFSPSTIPRLYHSGAMLLPDGSILLAGSNPNPDVNLKTVYPTTYKADIFYPPYFSAKVRPQPSGVPKTLSYGGPAFDITIPESSYVGTANSSADSATVVLIRGGFTTHAMNMGQRFLQLQTSFTVGNDSSITLHCAQMPPNPAIFQPGPALLFVTINGIPSKGQMVIIGTGNFGAQPTAAAAVLPEKVYGNGHGTADGSTNAPIKPDGGAGGKVSTAAIIGGIVGAVAVFAVLGALFAIFIARRRRAAGQKKAHTFSMSATPPGSTTDDMAPPRRPFGGDNDGDSMTSYAPLRPAVDSWAGSSSMSSLGENATPYRDSPNTPMSNTPRSSTYGPLVSNRVSTYGALPTQDPPTPAAASADFNPYANLAPAPSKE